MNSVERVKSICKNRKIPISRLEKDLGFGNGYISQLRKGTFPGDRLAAIAKYLDTTTEFLLNGDQIEKTPTLTAKDERNDSMENKLIELYRELNEEGQEKLIDYADDMVRSGKYIKTDEIIVDKEA